MAPPLTQQQGALGAIARFWQRSYAPDYLGFIVLEVAYELVGSLQLDRKSCLLWTQITSFVTPFHRMFTLDDHNIQYPHTLIERVPSYMNVIYSLAIPLGLFFTWTLVVRPKVHKAHVTILGLLISIALATVLTDIIKNAIGRPRPDLIARCKPEKGTAEHLLVTIDVCSETDPQTLQDGWRSFPSGHSSFAFAGLGYLALFFAGQLHVFRPRTDLARVLVALAPLIGAAEIAMSRMADYRHDVYDVTVGSVLGMSMAYFSYRRYFPGLRHSRCDEPYPSRAQIADANGTGKLKDDEESHVRSAGGFSLADSAEDDEELFPLTNEGSGVRGSREPV